MKSRERVRLILNHQEADRPAIDLGATAQTGTSAWSYRALKRLLGVASDQVRVFDLYQMLAQVEPEVLDAVGGDFVMLPRDTQFGFMTNLEWKPMTFWDGQTFEVPVNFEPDSMPDGSLEFWADPDNQRYRMRLPKGGRFFDGVPDPSANSMEIPHVDEADWTLPQLATQEYLDREHEKARKLYESTDRAIVTFLPYEVPISYCDFFRWALKMMTDPDHCHAYMMKFAEAAARTTEQYLEAVGEYVDVVFLTGADFGMQDREQFRPDLFEEFYVPAWRMVTDVVHRFPHVKTFIHCCGSVPNLIPHFIAAGVDCLNPVQWTAANMDPKTLKQKYGDKLTFWGGAINTQKTFPRGTPDEVRREAREILDIFAPGGGYVVNPIHNILPEVPPENIVALYETAKAYRYGANG